MTHWEYSEESMFGSICEDVDDEEDFSAEFLSLFNVTPSTASSSSSPATAGASSSSSPSSPIVALLNEDAELHSVTSPPFTRSAPSSPLLPTKRLFFAALPPPPPAALVSLASVASLLAAKEREIEHRRKNKSGVPRATQTDPVERERLPTSRKLVVVVGLLLCMPCIFWTLLCIALGLQSSSSFALLLHHPVLLPPEEFFQPHSAQEVVESPPLPPAPLPLPENDAVPPVPPVTRIPPPHSAPFLPATLDSEEDDPSVAAVPSPSASKKKESLFARIRTRAKKVRGALFRFLASLVGY